MVCCFISTLIILVLATRPERIIKLFSQDLDSALIGAGVCGVQVFINGRIQTILVDDWFPFTENGDMLCSPAAKAEDIEKGINTWVAFVEKAFAKLLQGYQNLNTLKMETVLELLTGCESDIM